METHILDRSPDAQLHVPTFDGPLGRAIIETHVWAVREGLSGATAHDLFDGYCQRLVVQGVPLWRAHTAMETLHPQWSGYGYTWRSDLNAIQPEQYARSEITGPDWLSRPMYDLICRARNGEDDPWMRRRLETGPDQRDFQYSRNSSHRGQPIISRSFSRSASAVSFARDRRCIFFRKRSARRLRG